MSSLFEKQTKNTLVRARVIYPLKKSSNHFLLTPTLSNLNFVFAKNINFVAAAEREKKRWKCFLFYHLLKQKFFFPQMRQ